MLRRCQRIVAGNVELLEADIMQEHVDTAEVVRGGIHLLTKVF